MKEVFSEVFTVMRHNRARLTLTGFSIGWGLFILIVMIGSGNGVVRGVIQSFGTDTVCTLYLRPGKTSIAYNGFCAQRSITLHTEDAEDLMRSFPDDISNILMQNTLNGTTVSLGIHRINTSIIGCDIGNTIRDNNKIVEGRDFTELDLHRHTRVCLIGKQTQDILFGKNANAIGSTIIADSVAIKVVGVYDNENGYSSGHIVYMPFTTAQDLFAQDGTLSKMTIVASKIKDEKGLQTFEETLRNHLAKRLSFSPKDLIAVSIQSYTDSYFQLSSIMHMLQIFIWIVGLATMVSGVVGVSNIMIIGIRERTREFGVRIAMGASDTSIIRLVMIESLLVTLFFGYIGLTAGILLTEGMAWILTSLGGVTFFVNPTIDFNILLASLAIMIIAGIIAGFFPARQIVRMKLVDALNG